MRAGVQPERIVAGILLLSVAAWAAALGSAAILEAILSSSSLSQPRSLPWGLTAVGFGAALTWLSVVVLAGRHSQRALAVATLLIMALVIALLGSMWNWATILLLFVIAFTNIVALVIGAYRLAQRE